MTKITIGNDTIDIPDAELEKLRKKYGKKDKYPKVGTIYWFCDGVGCESNKKWNNDKIDKFLFGTGNFFLSREKADAKIKLLNHIAKFDEPEEGRGFYHAAWGNGWEFFYEYKRCIWHKPDFYAGLIMHISSTQEEREYRMELLKKVYGNE